MGGRLEAVMGSFGVSPWELEVAFGCLDGRFAVKQEAIGEDPDFVSVLNIGIPVAFSREFFDWFEFKRWERIKALFREMKRRRGSRRALKVRIDFAGSPAVSFVADAAERGLFDNSIEKIDFVLELLPYHLGPGGLPEGATRVTYKYDAAARRWQFGEALAGGRRFAFAGGSWSALT